MIRLVRGFAAAALLFLIGFSGTASAFVDDTKAYRFFVKEYGWVDRTGLDFIICSGQDKCKHPGMIRTSKIYDASFYKDRKEIDGLRVPGWGTNPNPRSLFYKKNYFE